MTVLSAAARLNVSKTAVPRTPDAPVQNDALTVQNYSTERSERLAELTCYNDLHMLMGTDELTTDCNRTTVVLPTPSRKCQHNDN